MNLYINLRIDISVRLSHCIQEHRMSFHLLTFSLLFCVFILFVLFFPVEFIEPSLSHCQTSGVGGVETNLIEGKEKVYDPGSVNPE